MAEAASDEFHADSAATKPQSIRLPHHDQQVNVNTTFNRSTINIDIISIVCTTKTVFQIITFFLHILEVLHRLFCGVGTAQFDLLQIFLEHNFAT